jgi:hypothetical protein
MKNFNKTFSKIFIITYIFYIILLSIRIAFFNHNVELCEVFLGLGGLILICTELILSEVKKNK